MSKIEVTYIDHMGSDLTVVNSARVSFGKRIDVLEAKDEKLIKYLADHQHLTPFEHCTLTLLIKCPLYIRSQIHRHRTFAFNEISRRYTSENLEFHSPTSYRVQNSISKQCSNGNVDANTEIRARIIAEDLENASLKAYNDMLDLGIAREQARAMLSQSLCTEFFMTGNLRNWIHFLKLRLDAHAQLEVQEVAQPIVKIIEEHFPVSAKALFDI